MYGSLFKKKPNREYPYTFLFKGNWVLSARSLPLSKSLFMAKFSPGINGEDHFITMHENY